ncbi:ImmA/IrrE family metallo-endopeptidase [Enterococcus mundtii]|uniref:ImmA/IrrE family metallo-endopeptidase n=1 Tax=Enterococcus TaxID=1350 RepID=UPI00232D26C4|nr:ImmA/IrrE family metallo-endopeptidase [Enterococcus mundtii]MDB7086338.1 ImmA/IrrE family metallo-endopeptidase [Enterococcus mundtii]
MTEVENIEFIDYKFKNNLNKLLLGSISKVQDEFIITTNKNLSDEYKNFTKMHDIIHYYRDYSYNSESHAFSDFILQKDYLPEDFDKEVAADIGAGILMVNDQALRYALKKFKKFNDISNYFNMSKSAFRVRTIQYLEFNEKFTYNTAYKLFKYFYCTS